MCQPGRPLPMGVSQAGSPSFCGFPQNEVAGVVFVVFVHVDARAGADAAEVVVRELAVFGKLRDAVVDRAVAHISMPALGQFLDGVHHFGDVLGGLDDVLGALQPQRRGVFEERLGVDLGELVDRSCRAAVASRMILSSMSVMFIT